jgi:hypothetical protein
VRWPGERNLSDTALEDDAVFRQRVHVGSEAAGVAVATHAIGAQGVHCNNQDVRTRRFLLTAGAEEQREPKQE